MNIQNIYVILKLTKNLSIMAWFNFTGSNPTDASHYTLVGSQPSCTGAQSICAIQANNDGEDNPVLTNALKNEMIQALNDGLSSSNVKLRTRPTA